MTKISFISLILGWALGICSHLAIDNLRRFFSKRDLMKGLETELSELVIILVGLSYRLGSHSGTYDSRFLDWCAKMYKKAKLSAIMEELAQLGNDDIAGIRYLQRAKNENVGLGLKTYNLVFLDSRIRDLPLLEVSSQSILLKIKSLMGLLNEEVRYTMKCHYMTYDSSITPENHQTLKLQIESHHSNIQDMAIRIVDHIDDFFEKVETTSRTNFIEKGVCFLKGLKK